MAEIEKSKSKGHERGHKSLQNESAGDKMWSCSACGKQFGKKSSLDLHIAFKHSLITKTFNTSSSLDQKTNNDGDIDCKDAVLDEISNRTSVYKCHICGKEYNIKGSLKTHVIYAHGDETYTCDICDMTFPTKSMIKLHLIVHDPTERYHCYLCGRRFKRIASLWRHMKIHFDKETIAAMREKPPKVKPLCEICGVVFTSRSGLKRHLENTHGGAKNCICDFCGKGTGTKDAMISHLAGHYSSRPFKCDYCDKSYKRRCTLNDHVIIHTDKNHGHVGCKICGKEVMKKSLWTHMYVHSKEKRFTCDICFKSYKNRSSLACHVKQRHGQWKPFECTICHERLNTAGSLKVHARVHERITPFHCTICEKQFAYSGSLIVHKRTHVGVKPYACDVCKKRFSASNTLKNHMLQHTNERAYECYLCGLSWKRKQGVREHMVKHTGIPLYECELCPMKFEGLCAMTHHKKAHKKPEICQICGFGFDDELILMKHMSSHRVKKLQCAYCTEMFYKYDINAHVREVHKDLLLR